MLDMGRTVGEQERRRRAIQRALSLGLPAAVERVRYGWYRLPSTTRPDTYWTVRVSVDGRWSCDCEAGRSGHPCVHQAAVLIAKTEAASKGRVTRPATSERGN
jgi:hypothetical protein